MMKMSAQARQEKIRARTPLFPPNFNCTGSMTEAKKSGGQDQQSRQDHLIPGKGTGTPDHCGCGRGENGEYPDGGRGQGGEEIFFSDVSFSLKWQREEKGISVVQFIIGNRSHDEDHADEDKGQVDGLGAQVAYPMMNGALTSVKR